LRVSVGSIKPTYRAANAATATEDEPTPNSSLTGSSHYLSLRRQQRMKKN
jgi:hypothetical protein